MWLPAGPWLSVQFEWQGGPAHSTLIKRLLDPEFGPGARLELRKEQTEQGRMAGTAGYVWLRPASAGDADGSNWRLLTSERSAERGAIERAHGYISGTPDRMDTRVLG